MLPIGKFKICKSGITAVFKPPVPSILSRHYPWKQVPMILGLLELLIYGDNDACEFALSKLTDCQLALSNDLFGRLEWIEENGQNVLLYETEFVESLLLLIQWAPLLAEQCPYKSVSYDLEKMSEWDIDTQSSYVMRNFVN